MKNTEDRKTEIQNRDAEIHNALDAFVRRCAHHEKADVVRSVVEAVKADLQTWPDPVPIPIAAQRCALCGAFYPQFRTEDPREIVKCQRCGSEWTRSLG